MISVYYLVSIGIVVLGIILFAILANRKNYRTDGITQEANEPEPEPEPIKRYKKGRDKLTFRESNTTSYNSTSTVFDSGFSIMGILPMIIGTLVVGYVMWTVFSTVTTTLCDTMNTTGYTSQEATVLFSCVNGQITGGLVGFFPIVIIVGLILPIFFTLTKLFR